MKLGTKIAIGVGAFMGVQAIAGGIYCAVENHKRKKEEAEYYERLREQQQKEFEDVMEAGNIINEHMDKYMNKK